MKETNLKYKTIAIIGRPNVGKSTLFNRIIKEKKSIVDDTPGVTRDKLYAEFEWNEKIISLIDTGGLVSGDTDEISNEVKKQVFSAVEEADYILFMVDGREGVNALDEEIAGILRKIKNKKKIFLAVNKVDSLKQESDIYDFYSLGLGEPYPISALAGSIALADILDEIASSSSITAKANEDLIKVSIVGKPNVGKSSILNSLLGKERAIVSSIPGTTRDSLDVKTTVNDQTFLLVDTAGLRRKSKVDTNVERYATSRAISSIEKSDVVILVLESIFNVSDQDKKIASVIKKRNKASVVLLNKWDLIENKTSENLNLIIEDVLKSLQFVNYSKVLNTSAINKKNINRIWDLVRESYDNFCKRISTSKLNKALEEIIYLTSPPTGKGGKSLRIYYITQSDIKPPEIVFFVNDSDLVKTEYERFLEKELRKRFDFSGTPLKLVFRNKKE